MAEINCREAWLLAATHRLNGVFDAVGYDVPTVHVSCGWPSKGGLAKGKRRIGECWKAEASADATPQIFISPVLADPIKVLETLVHEVIHAVLPDAKHGKQFKEAMKNLGLEGPATATFAGDALRETLKDLAETLGPYPHAKLDKLASPTKPDTTRMLKVVCEGPQDPHKPYILRGARATLDLGLPKCPVCDTIMTVEESPKGSDSE